MSRAVVINVCFRCKGRPCICAYLDRLSSGTIPQRIKERIYARALHKHEPALNCPCPRCHRARLASREGVTS